MVQLVRHRPLNRLKPARTALVNTTLGPAPVKVIANSGIEHMALLGYTKPAPGSRHMVLFGLERLGRPKKIGPRIVVCALGCSLTRRDRLQVFEINAVYVVYYLRVGASNGC